MNPATFIFSVPITAVLFFDEANTTESIGLIKEIMCDLTCNGQPVDTQHGLKIIAAANPYKKHSPEMIDKLEGAGLGFFTTADETRERFGQIPMRQLVYRVQALPSSLLPIVWDFGRLEVSVERTYIEQMVKRGLAAEQSEMKLLVELIACSQEFMRSKSDECSFVSIRDVERVIKVSAWFVRKRDVLFERMRSKKIEGCDDRYQEGLSDVRRAFVLALSVCYHSCLQSGVNRQEYRQRVHEVFGREGGGGVEWPSDWMLCEVLKCQNVFMDEISLKVRLERKFILTNRSYRKLIHEKG